MTAGLPPHSGKVTLIANPASGGHSKRRLNSALRILESMDIPADLRLTSGTADATRIAAQAAQAGVGLVIAAGGDGTYNEVLNGLVGTGVAMGILPLGTTNVLARELGIPLDAEGAIKAALLRAPREVSVGRVEARGSTRHFCLMAGVGFDAQTVLGVGSAAKRLTGKAAYVASAFGALLSWSPGELKVRADGLEHTCRSLIAANARKYAGEYSVAPDADIAAPRLDLVLLEGATRQSIIRYAFSMMRGRLHQEPDVTVIQCSRVEVEGDAHIQVDGDHIGHTPALITVVPAALKLVY